MRAAALAAIAAAAAAAATGELDLDHARADVIEAQRQRRADRATTELVTEHLWLPRMIARSYRVSRDLRGDLEQAGTEGLILAARRFDPSRGVPFVAYAVFSVRDYAHRELERYARAQGRELDVTEERIAGDAPTPEAELLEREGAELQAARLAALEAFGAQLRGREAIVWGDVVAQRSPRETAQALAVTRDQVQRLRRRLKQRAAEWIDREVQG